MFRSAGAALAAGLWPGRNFADEAKGENGNFEFIAVNDLHFADAKKCPPWFEKVFAAMRESSPAAEFVIVSGDLTQVNTDMEYGGIKELFPLLKVPVHVTLGNHDVTETGDRSKFDQFFPGARNYVVEHRGWQIFNLDSVENRAPEKTVIPKETIAWLADNLKKYDPKKPTIISTHFPLGAGHSRKPKNADAMVAPFKGFNVRHIFNGHWHGYSEMELLDGVKVTTNRCCSRYRRNSDGSPYKGWFVCSAKDGNVSRRFVTIPQELLKLPSDDAAS